MAIGEDKGVKLLRKVLELDPIEFLGICKILGVKTVVEEVTFDSSESTAEGGLVNGKVELTPRPFKDIWVDVCDAVNRLNRVQKRNLNRLLKAATKKEK